MQETIDGMFASAKEKQQQQKKSVKKQRIDYIPYYLSGLIVASTVFSDDLSRNSCIQAFEVVCTYMIFNRTCLQ